MRARHLALSDSWVLEGCSGSASTMLSLIYLALLWQQSFSPAMGEYRIYKEYRMLPSIFQRLEFSHGTLAFVAGLWPTGRRKEAAAFGPTHHLCQVPMHMTVTFIGAGKEC